MPKSFRQCLGETGQLVSASSQAFVEDRVYVNNGICNSMCIQKMYGIMEGRLPSQKEMLEFGQWAREERGKCSARISESLHSRNVQVAAEYKGRWVYDELYAGNFIQASGYYYYLVGILNTARSEGHALLVYSQAEKWLLYDPNFGTASFPYVGACLLALKRIMQNIYPSFGPFFPFVIWRLNPLPK